VTLKKRTLLASAGAAGVLGALAIGGVAFAVGGYGGSGQSQTPAYVTVEGDGSSTAPAQRDGGRDCPEKQGGESTTPGTPSTPSSPESEAPSPTPSESSDTAADL
jgi:hypothetical protein